MNILGKKVILRAMEEKDLDLIVDMFNDPEMESNVVGWAFPLSITQQKKWFENNLLNQNDFRFIIETPDDGAVGVATLTNIDWKNRSATHGIKLASLKVKEKGIGTDSVMAIMRYAFTELQLNRLEGSWFPENIPSKKLYMKLGWKVEGCKKQYAFKKGKYRDLEISAILKDEYDELIESTHYWD